MRWLWKLCMPMTAVLCVLALLAGTPAQAQTSQRCFTETGQCISGRIREYWERNGGLPVFGLPLGPQQEMTIEGKSIQAQWFERNRLELHPENARPYDVLLGRLGADVLAQQGRDWFTFPTVDEASGGDAESCRFFKETRHTVCGEFVQAYRLHGLDLGAAGNSYEESLALFGLPLSQPMTETIEGKEYQVQWFERARFELHPELRSRVRILFGRLGAEIQPMTTSPLANTTWQLVTYGAANQPQAAVAAAPATLRFGADGRVTGSGGCNSFAGTYTATANQLTFGALAATLRACAGDVSQQEQEVLAALKGSVRYASDAGTLRIFYNQDQSQLTYHAVPASTATVSGTVSYRERIALPNGATITVRLLDISRQDVPAAVLAEQVITTNGQQVPIEFALTYDPAQIDPRGTYSVRAEISANGQRLFTTTAAYLVITQGRPTIVDLVLQRVNS